MERKVKPGKIAGLLNGFCYLGSTISSYGLGSIANAGGWNAVFMIIFILSLICTLFGVFFFIKKRTDKC